MVSPFSIDVEGVEFTLIVIFSYELERGFLINTSSNNRIFVVKFRFHWVYLSLLQHRLQSSHKHRRVIYTLLKSTLTNLLS